MDRELPDDVQMLLRERIHSLEQLEIVLLVRKLHEQDWTVDAVGKSVSLPTVDVVDVLEHLQTAGLLTCRREGRLVVYRYQLAPPEVEAAVDTLARLYRETPLSVIRVLNANAIDRVRTGAIKMFADAFVIRGGKKNG